MGLRAENDPSFYLYVLECADGTWYTGYTVDVAERVRAHNAGAGAKYTRSRLPVRLLAQAAYATKHEAMSAEFRFKRLSRAAKDDLLARARTAGFAEALAAGIEWIPHEERLRLEEEKANAEAEEARKAELRAYCERKGLKYEEKEAEYLAKQEAKRAAAKAKADAKAAKAAAKAGKNAPAEQPSEEKKDDDKE